MGAAAKLSAAVKAAAAKHEGDPLARSLAATVAALVGEVGAALDGLLDRIERGEAETLRRLTEIERRLASLEGPR